ncbi:MULTISPECIES: FAD-binding protein [unclassified Adlercreutzia]|uniref:FAD-binding protein n=1 Tax=unclassified Adlercreutzia TaxID=2636013 RepID=UPI0013E9CF8F|nr:MULTISPECIES: FAD-binding protein [unclassified Adlercreutzia]
MTRCENVWVAAEDASDYAALVAVARDLGARVSAVWMGDEQGLDAVSTSGAGAVIHLEGGVLIEDGAPVLAQLAAERTPDALIVAPTKRMRLVGACVAARMRACVISDATSLDVDEEGALRAERMVYGGGAVTVERAVGAFVVAVPCAALLASKAAERADASGAAGADAPCAVETFAVQPGSSGITLVERRAREVDAVNLSAARNIVSVGRGFAAEEDLALAYGLARAVDAEVGCTRPVAEGSKWMARERYIGVSGAMLTPNLFIAVGVSGQVQHMVGATGAKVVVAINKDKGAPVFKQADFGIVGDLYDVVPRLVAELER